MTYPPQQPGPYGQDPYGQQQPPQTPPYGGQSSYQGLGSYGPPPPPPPKKPNTGMIVAIVLIVLLVLGGGGVAVWVLTKNNDSNSASDDGKTDQSSSPSTEDEPTDQPTEPTEDTGDQGGGDASNSPDDVRDAYMAAYESKSFSSVVNSACAAYKTKYGTDTSSLEKQLEPYDITATASGEPDVNGNTATADIDLALAHDGTTERPTIFIKIVEEDGEWRFCGEGEAS